MPKHKHRKAIEVTCAICGMWLTEQAATCKPQVKGRVAITVAPCPNCMADSGGRGYRAGYQEGQWDGGVTERVVGKS